MAIHAQQDTSHALTKILIVDDDHDDRRFLKKILRDLDLPVEIYEADNVIDGLMLQKEKHPDCVLLDYMMPDTNGFSFLEAPQQHEKDHEVPIIMVSGQTADHITQKSLQLGAAECLSKQNLRDDLLLYAIKTAIEKSQLRQTLHNYRHELAFIQKGVANFISTATHDLRAPMRRIGMFCDLLMQDEKNYLTENSQEICERIQINSTRLQYLLTALQEYATTNIETEKQASVDLNFFIEDVFSEYEPVLEKKKISLTYHKLPTLKACPEKIKVLLRKIIENALTYHADRSLHLSVDAEETANEIIISFTDNGCGIPQEKWDDVFDPFVRLHAADTIEGAGLGLSICQNIMRYHHGQMSITASDKTGTTFSLSFPKKNLITL